MIFLGFILFQNGYLMIPDRDSNTFWMISGTAKFSLNLGPINGHFWASGPRIYGFPYTQILQNILESIWEHLGTILFLHIRESTFSIVFRIS